MSQRCHEQTSLPPLPFFFVSAKVNTPPPKGGGFKLRLEAGLIDPSGRFSQTTLKLSSGSSGF